MTMDGWDRGEPALADPDFDQWVEEDLVRVERQRVASLRAVADSDAWERRCLEAMSPLSATIASAFRRFEQANRTIRASRRHEVVVRLRRPAATSIRVTLRWGSKFALTDTERALMRGFQRRPRRLVRYPEVVVAQDYHQLVAVLDGDQRTLRLGSGQAEPIDRYLASPSLVERYLEAGLLRPPSVSVTHHRSEGYRQHTR